MSGHEEHVERAQNDLSDLEERGEALGDEISRAKRKLADDPENTPDDEMEGAIGDSPEDTEPDIETGATAPQGWNYS